MEWTSQNLDAIINLHFCQFNPSATLNHSGGQQSLATLERGQLLWGRKCLALFANVQFLSQEDKVSLRAEFVLSKNDGIPFPLLSDAFISQGQPSTFGIKELQGRLGMSCFVIVVLDPGY